MIIIYLKGIIDLNDDMHGLDLNKKGWFRPVGRMFYVGCLFREEEREREREAGKKGERKFSPSPLLLVAPSCHQIPVRSEKNRYRVSMIEGSCDPSGDDIQITRSWFVCVAPCG